MAGPIKEAIEWRPGHGVGREGGKVMLETVDHLVLIHTRPEPSDVEAHIVKLLESINLRKGVETKCVTQWNSSTATKELVEANWEQKVGLPDPRNVKIRIYESPLGPPAQIPATHQRSRG